LLKYSVLLNGTASEPALSGAEGCRKRCLRLPALAAEVRFSLCCRIFQQALLPHILTNC
jgi:hypothetical protein